jgi:hypothetical protein
MTFEERLEEMARYMPESQRRWEERDEKIQQRLNNLAATFSEEHWRFQKDMRALGENSSSCKIYLNDSKMTSVRCR